MINENNIWAVIVKYLEGTMTKNDSGSLESWLGERSENRRILQSVDQIWKATSENKSQENFFKELNLEKDWDRVAERIQQKQSSGEQKKKVENFTRLRKRQQLISNLLRVAALFLVGLTSAFLALQYAPVDESPVYGTVFREISTKAGERANIDLGDGTKVFLNADSKISVPDTFSPDQRVVRLSGQAFFDVTQDESRPFYIETSQATIQVIGTSFDVKSYENEDKVQVAVKEGVVELHKSGGETEKRIITEGYLGSFNRQQGLMSVVPVEDMEIYTGWMDGRLVFKNTPFIEVLQHIERWYNVDIYSDISDEELLQKEFTADLKTRSVADVFDVIGMSMNIEYDISEARDTIRIRKNK